MKIMRKMIVCIGCLFVIGLCCVNANAATKISAPKVSSTNVSSTGKIKLTWSKVNGAVKYKVYRATSKDGTYTLLKTLTSTSLTNTSAKAGTSYYYYVRAVDKNGKVSSKSNIISRTCDLARPVISVSNVSSTGKIKISWDKVDRAVKYKVYRATSKDGTYTLLKTTTSTSITNTSAVAGKTYYYKVKAIAQRSAADSAYSAVKSRTCDCAKPLVKIALDSAGKPKLTWEAVTGAKSYEVYRSVSANGKYILLKETTKTSFSNSGAGEGLTYYYKVKALGSKNAADSGYSSVKSVTTSAPENEKMVTSYVATPNVYIYPQPTDSAKATILPYMTKVGVGSAVSTVDSGSWVRVSYKNDIYYTWIPKGVSKFTKTQSSFQYIGNTATQQEVIDEALRIYEEWDVFYTNSQSTGEPNANGTYGFDCSGYVSYVLNKVIQKTVPTYRVTKNITDLYNTKLLYNDGYNGEYSVKTVSLSNIQPGDILFFNVNGSKVDHCGIYLGNNEFIHCTQFWDGVTIMPLPGSFTDDLVDVKRFFPTKFNAANQKMTSTISGVYMYIARDDASERIHTFSKNEEITLLYTSSNGTWGYAKTSDGLKGFVLMKWFE